MAGVAAPVGIFYGSTSYGTAAAALLVQEAFAPFPSVLVNVNTAHAADVERHRLLVFGTSTWGEGGLQHDWDRFIWELDQADLRGRKAAVFALGDQVVWSRTFVDSMRTVYDKLKERGGRVVGQWPIEGYEFEASRAVIDGRFVGLALDKMNQRDRTPLRVKRWVEGLKREFGLVGPA